MIDTLKPLIKQFLPFAQERMGFEHPPRLFVRQDADNAANPLGKTAYYDPEASSVTLYVTDRHPKDVMRSLSHELVHHTQHCNGEFENTGEMGEGYAQNNPHMREMERQAYEVGNLCFRDWEDSLKGTIYNEHLQKGVEKNMSTKDWKDGELNSLLLEKWGFKFNLDRLSEQEEQEEEVVEEEVEEEKEIEEGKWGRRIGSAVGGAAGGALGAGATAGMGGQFVGGAAGGALGGAIGDKLTGNRDEEEEEEEEIEEGALGKAVGTGLGAVAIPVPGFGGMIGGAIGDKLTGNRDEGEEEERAYRSLLFRSEEGRQADVAEGPCRVFGAVW